LFKPGSLHLLRMEQYRLLLIPATAPAAATVCHSAATGAQLHWHPPPPPPPPQRAAAPPPQRAATR
jgi:hypothetical protein